MGKNKDEYQQALEDLGELAESTTQLIDMPFRKFAEFLEGKNIGMLKAYRLLMQRNLDQADALGKQVVENTVTTLNKQDRIKLGSVFAVVSKIVERMGYIDLLIEKNSL